LNEILPSNGFAQGQMKWAKQAWKYSTYDVTHKKSKTKNFFFSLQSWRLAVSFEGMNSSRAQSPGKLCSLPRHVQTVCFSLKRTGSNMVL